MKACVEAVLVKQPVVDTPIVIPVESAIGTGNAAEYETAPEGNA